jgi:isocitrate dehydrogenase (NAD+)
MRIVLIEGDGVGPELVESAAEVMMATGLEIEWERRQAGFTTFRQTGEVVPAETLAAIRRTGAALKGPFLTPAGGGVRSGNWYIRRELGLFAGLRPIERPQAGIDLLIVRENVEDLYGAAEAMILPDVAEAIKVASLEGCRRIARYAFDVARRYRRRRVTVVHKANNLKLTEGMFLDVARQVAAADPEIELDDMLVDSAAYTLVTDPSRFQVILTSNTFGDILSGIGAALEGSMGQVPSLNVGDGVLVAEASHGAAVSLAGKGVANPIATIRSGGLMLESLGYEEGTVIRQAVADVLATGARTPDMGGTASTREITRMVADRVHERARGTRTPTSATVELGI